MKTDGRIDRNSLAGTRGDAVNALPCGAGYNLRLIIDNLRRLSRALLQALADQRCTTTQPHGWTISIF